MLKRVATKASRRTPLAVNTQARWTHKKYVNPTTAKMDHNYPTWAEDYSFDDLPYTRVDMFFFNETPIRQHRLIETKLMARLLREDRVPEALMPIVKEIFVAPKVEEQRLNVLYWKICDLLNRRHPDFLALQDVQCKVRAEDSWKVNAALRSAIRIALYKQKNAASEIISNYANQTLTPTFRSRYPEEENFINDADFQAVAVSAAVAATGGPQIDVRFGRQSFDPYLPDPAKDSAETMRAKLMGFSDEEIVACCMVNSLKQGVFTRQYLVAALEAGSFKDDGLKAAAQKLSADLERCKQAFGPAFQKLMELGQPNLQEAPYTAPKEGHIGTAKFLYNPDRDEPMVATDITV